MISKESKRYVLLSEKEWHDALFVKVTSKSNSNYWTYIKDKKSFSFETLQRLNPDKIFIPHWSYIIPKKIYENFECIVFHMTDLPYGRGGSPLQNLIERGHEQTKISAIRVGEGIDTGPVYLKGDLNLKGTAYDIFVRAAVVIESMILEIIESTIVPTPQKGTPKVFKRRNQAQSEISNLMTLDKVFDYIRMLDCEGYPRAFMETEHLRFEFDNAEMNQSEIRANVRITEK